MLIFLQTPARKEDAFTNIHESAENYQERILMLRLKTPQQTLAKSSTAAVRKSTYSCRVDLPVRGMSFLLKRRLKRVCAEQSHT